MRTTRPHSQRFAAQKRPPLPTAAEREAQLQAEQTAAATDRAIEQLGRFLGPNKDRKIVSQTRAEVECVAVGAVKGYVLTRNKQDAAERLDDRVDDLKFG